MLDIGFSKILLIGGIALVVIGPERLPRVARTIGTLLGRAQRYVADVKSEVSRSIELEELQRMKTEFESGARDVEQTLNNSLNESTREVESALALGDSSSDISPGWPEDHPAYQAFLPTYQRPNKKWRLKRGALPLWYKRQTQVRGHVQSGAARVARHRPRRA
jgi:sec-independent protein translocase protein TatB